MSIKSIITDNNIASAEVDGKIFNRREETEGSVVYDLSNVSPASADIPVGGVAPANPSLGDLWFNNDTQDLSVYVSSSSGPLWLSMKGQSGSTPTFSFDAGVLTITNS